MNSALLRHKIEIHSLSTTKSEYGTITTDYKLKYTTRAHVIFNSETQVVSEGEIYFPVLRTFIVRSHVPVVETDRIFYDDKWWRITSINKNDYYNNTEISCTLVNS